jgi:hypothetical protein
MYLPNCEAARLYLRVRGCSAWSLTDTERAALKSQSRNAYGKSLTFDDGSRVFIPKGSASVMVRRFEGGRTL